MRIERDDLTRPEVHALLAEHLENMHQLSPVDSVHALGLDQLRAPGITFWSVWSGTELVGCGALKELSSDHGEIKSMRTPAAKRRQGAGRRVLGHIIGEATRRGYSRLSLETGSGPTFDAAHKLYSSVGFKYCGPFGNYAEDPNSRFMCLDLQEISS
ncbi:MAG: GNAT family N-acetyltransferase [Pseudomonadota bacterium]